MCARLMYAMMLCMILVSFREGFRRIFNVHTHAHNLTNQYLTFLGVQYGCLVLYTSYIVGNMHDKFEGCTVDVQVTMVF